MPHPVPRAPCCWRAPLWAARTLLSWGADCGRPRAPVGHGTVAGPLAAKASPPRADLGALRMDREQPHVGAEEPPGLALAPGLAVGRAGSPSAWCPASGGQERTGADSSCWLSRWHRRPGEGSNAVPASAGAHLAAQASHRGCCQHLCPRAVHGAPPPQRHPRISRGSDPGSCRLPPDPGSPQPGKQSLFPQPSSSPERKPDILGARLPAAGTPS